MLSNKAPLKQYYNSRVKAYDREYSILPTLIKLSGDIYNKEVVHLGCGSGFLTCGLAKRTKEFVRGIEGFDYSLKVARNYAELHACYNVSFKHVDMLDATFPEAPFYLISFTPNACTTKEKVKIFLSHVSNAVEKGGKIILMLDYPQKLHKSGAKKFGAVRKVDSFEDESPMQVDLYRDNALLCVLKAQFYTKDFIIQALEEKGFANIAEHDPIVSQEGYEKLGEQFWKSYFEDPGILYLSAEKQ